MRGVGYGFDVAVIWGGASGFFAALAGQRENLDGRGVILEKTAVLLSKVRVSGGERLYKHDTLICLLLRNAGLGTARLRVIIGKP